MRTDTYGLENFELSYKMSRLSDSITQQFWTDHADQIERFIRSDKNDSKDIKKFYDALENRVVQQALQGLGVKKYKDLMDALVRSKFWKLFNSKTSLLRGDLSMQRNFKDKTASRLQKWAANADTPDERMYLEKLAQIIDSPAKQAGLPTDELESGVAPEAVPGLEGLGNDMAALQGGPSDVVDLSTGENSEEETKGQYDITREPATPMWNIELLRVKANTSEEAQKIVEKFVGWARDHGQPRISVGTIKKSRDDDDKTN